MEEQASNIVVQLEHIKALLHSQALNHKKVFNLEELSEYTGFSIDYIYKLTHRQQIPFSKPSGKVLFFEKAKIDEWLLSNPSLTKDEMQAIAANKLVKRK